jgi:uncharacterized BrkB/YihY/UPF0761 family membrane protein
MKNYFRIFILTVLIVIVSILSFNVFLRLLNNLFPAVVLIEKEEKHVMPIGNLLWSFTLSLVTFFILFSIALKKLRNKK